MAVTVTSIERREARAAVLVVARIIFVALGLLAVAWGVYAFNLSREAIAVERVGKRVISGEQFKTETLLTMEPAIAGIEARSACDPLAQRASAFIRLRELETAMTAGLPAIADKMRATFQNSMQRSLNCAPADPFLWLIRYWLETVQNGVTPRAVEYLRMSYRTGPNEAWVALRRNRLALAAFAQLPPDLADMTTKEFASLVATRRVYQESVDIMKGPGWPIRDALAPKLGELPDDVRADFAGALHRAGLEVDIPGVARREPRPWQ
jgi:hypothetical protein